MTRRSTAADPPAGPGPLGTGPPGAGQPRLRLTASGHPPLDLTGLDKAGRVWALMRELAESYPPKPEIRAALNLGRGSGRFKALQWLAEGPLSLSQLADAVQVDAPYATLIVDTLEERGLVERRTDPADRRRKLVALTTAGAAAADAALQIIRQPPPGFAQLSPAELDTLEELVARIVGGTPPGREAPASG